MSNASQDSLALGIGNGIWLKLIALIAASGPYSGPMPLESECPEWLNALSGSMPIVHGFLFHLLSLPSRPTCTQEESCRCELWFAKHLDCRATIALRQGNCSINDEECLKTAFSLINFWSIKQLRRICFNAPCYCEPHPWASSSCWRLIGSQPCAHHGSDWNPARLPWMRTHGCKDICPESARSNAAR